jgi:hypothetical protein
VLHLPHLAKPALTNYVEIVEVSLLNPHLHQLQRIAHKLTAASGLLIAGLPGVSVIAGVLRILLLFLIG